MRFIIIFLGLQILLASDARAFTDTLKKLTAKFSSKKDNGAQAQAEAQAKIDKYNDQLRKISLGPNSSTLEKIKHHRLGEKLDKATNKLEEAERSPEINAIRKEQDLATQKSNEAYLKTAAAKTQVDHYTKKLAEMVRFHEPSRYQRNLNKLAAAQKKLAQEEEKAKTASAKSDDVHARYSELTSTRDASSSVNPLSKTKFGDSRSGSEPRSPTAETLSRSSTASSPRSNNQSISSDRPGTPSSGRRPSAEEDDSEDAKNIKFHSEDGLTAESINTETGVATHDPFSNEKRKMDPYNTGGNQQDGK